MRYAVAAIKRHRCRLKKGRFMNPYRMKRLVAALVRQCNLSTYEARGCIRAHRVGLKFASEAINHYGGVEACLKDAIERRNWGNPRRGPQWLNQLING